MFKCLSEIKCCSSVASPKRLVWGLLDQGLSGLINLMLVDIDLRSIVFDGERSPEVDLSVSGSGVTVFIGDGVSASEG